MTPFGNSRENSISTSQQSGKPHITVSGSMAPQLRPWRRPSGTEKICDEQSEMKRVCGEAAEQ